MIYLDFFSIGPAYAWSHLYLCLKRGGNPFELPIIGLENEHPNDHSRMMVLLLGLGYLNIEIDKIKEEWDSYKDCGLYDFEEAKFSMAYPHYLLEICVNYVFDAIEKIGCKIYNSDDKLSVASLLNESWEVFWDDPSRYREWEDKKVKELFVLI